MLNAHRRTRPFRHTFQFIHSHKTFFLQIHELEQTKPTKFPKRAETERYITTSIHISQHSMFLVVGCTTIVAFVVMVLVEHPSSNV